MFTRDDTHTLDPRTTRLDPHPLATREPTSPLNPNQPETYQQQPQPALPGGCLTEILGERPETSDANRRRWDHAAQVITCYRTEYDINPDNQRPLGPPAPAGQFQTRHHRDQAADQIIESLRLLDRTARDLTTLEDRALGSEGREREDAGNGLGWEP